MQYCRDADKKLLKIHYFSIVTGHILSHLFKDLKGT